MVRPIADGKERSTEIGTVPPGRHEDPLRETARRARLGDPVAIGHLFESLAPSLTRIARGVLGAHHPDIDDVVQESMIRLHHALGDFRGEGQLRHFAHRIAVRVGIDFARKRNRVARLEARGEDWRRDEWRELGAEPDDRRDTCKRLQILLEELSEVQAETLLLRAVEGYSIGEIAECTGTPLNTVRSRLRLAKEAIQRRIRRDPNMAELRRTAR